MFDLDQAGPSFGARALAALLAEGAPLHGLAATFDYVRYDWSNTTGLRKVLDTLGDGNVVAGSTEGGLFEFASDGDIVANLSVLRDCTPDDFVMVGPVVRDVDTIDPRLKALETVEDRPGIRFLGLAAFRKLAQRAGWVIGQVSDDLNPIHDVVSLRKAGPQDVGLL